MNEPTDPASELDAAISERLHAEAQAVSARKAAALAENEQRRVADEKGGALTLEFARRMRAAGISPTEFVAAHSWDNRRTKRRADHVHGWLIRPGAGRAQGDTGVEGVLVSVDGCAYSVYAEWTQATPGRKLLVGSLRRVSRDVGAGALAEALRHFGVV